MNFSQSKLLAISPILLFSFYFMRRILRWPERNPLEVLQLPLEFSDKALKQAYHKQVIRYHPDKHQGCNDAKKQFQLIQQSYDILKTREYRSILLNALRHQSYSQFILNEDHQPPPRPSHRYDAHRQQPSQKKQDERNTAELAKMNALTLIGMFVLVLGLHIGFVTSARRRQVSRDSLFTREEIEQMRARVRQKRKD